MNLDAFWEWLSKETPARADEITARVDILHRMLPKSFAGWPKGAAEVSDALRLLEVQGRVERVGSDWRWLPVGRKVEAEKQSVLF